jgi:hypothetical protein
MEPTATATIIQYALYIHHSQPRYKDGDPTKGLLAFGGYQPIFGGYHESLRVCLGQQPGTFVAQWITPSTNTPIGASQTIPWPGSTTCGNGGPGSIPINWPAQNYTYPYDIALVVTKQ